MVLTQAIAREPTRNAVAKAMVVSTLMSAAVQSAVQLHPTISAVKARLSTSQSAVGSMRPVVMATVSGIDDGLLDPCSDHDR